LRSLSFLFSIIFIFARVKSKAKKVQKANNMAAARLEQAMFLNDTADKDLIEQVFLFV
jgi:hypothetical protein